MSGTGIILLSTRHSALWYTKCFTILAMYDVLMIGSGLAGLHCARLLAVRGLRVALLDRKASLTDGIHTTGIFVRKTWEDFPLPDEQLGRAIRDVVLYSPARRPLRLAAARGEAPALHCFLDPRLAPGYIAWVATDGEETHVGVAGYRERFEPTLALRAFRDSVAHLAGGRAVERRGGVIPVGGILRRIAN